MKHEQSFYENEPDRLFKFSNDKKLNFEHWKKIENGTENELELKKFQISYFPELFQQTAAAHVRSKRILKCKSLQALILVAISIQSFELPSPTMLTFSRRRLPPTSFTKRAVKCSNISILRAIHAVIIIVTI